MRVWAVANQKGGVGKTTTVVSLGALLARAGCRTLLVDLDPHGSMTAYFGHDPETVEMGVYRLFAEPARAAATAAALAVPAVPEGLALWRASPAMATLDRQLGGADGMGLVLARALAGVADRFDYALLDCPPMLGVLMVNALAACERLIVPVQTEHLALQGLERMMRTLRMVQRARRRPLPYLIVPTLHDRRTRAALRALEALRSAHGDRVWDDVIPVDTRFREASRRGRALTEVEPTARGSQAYARLLARLLGGGAEAAGAAPPRRMEGGALR